MRFFILLLFALTVTNSFGQISNQKHIVPDKEYDNVHVKKIHSDDRATTFVIWVKKAVKSHRHESHTEMIVVFKGKGKMTVGDEVKSIKKGDIIIVPINTAHSVITTSRKPLKVLSVQAPVFLGKDRIWIEEK